MDIAKKSGRFCAKMPGMPDVSRLPAAGDYSHMNSNFWNVEGFENFPSRNFELFEKNKRIRKLFLRRPPGIIQKRIGKFTNE